MQLLDLLIQRVIGEGMLDKTSRGHLVQHHITNTHTASQVYVFVCIYKYIYLYYKSYIYIYICNTLNVSLGVSLGKLQLESCFCHYSISELAQSDSDKAAQCPHLALQALRHQLAG